MRRFQLVFLGVLIGMLQTCVLLQGYRQLSREQEDKAQFRNTRITCSTSDQKRPSSRRGEEGIIISVMLNTTNTAIEANNNPNNASTIGQPAAASLRPTIIAIDNRYWWEEQVKNFSIAIPFEPWAREKKDAWCLEYYFPMKSGLLFNKLFKTGSSSAVGIHLRIAKKVAERKGYPKEHPCATHYRHLFSLNNDQMYRKPSKSFLWSILRDPAARSISSYFYYNVGLHGESPATDNDDSFIDYLEATKNVQFHQVRDDSAKPKLKAKGGSLLLHREEYRYLLESTGMHHLEKTAQMIQTQVLKAYNFVALLERWDESLVVLQLLLDLEDEDVIVLSSKSSGDWSWDWRTGQKNSSCFFIPKPTISRRVARYIRQDFATNNTDYLLYAAANSSLDQTIDLLGRDRVEATLRRHQELQQMVQEQCRHKVKFPCSKDGKWQPEAETDCYWRDMGCGHQCIDRVLEEHRKSTIEQR